MKDYLDCAYHLGYSRGLADANHMGTPSLALIGHLHRLANNPGHRDVFVATTGHHLAGITRGNVVDSVCFWERGYRRGHADGRARLEAEDESLAVALAHYGTPQAT